MCYNIAQLLNENNLISNDNIQLMYKYRPIFFFSSFFFSIVYDTEILKGKKRIKFRNFFFDSWQFEW